MEPTEKMHCLVIWPTFTQPESINCPHDKCPLRQCSDNPESAKAELHINIWSIEDSSQNKRPKTLEIGLMIHATKSPVRRVNFLLPSQYSGTVSDLSEKLRDDDLINALFNADVSIEHSTTGAHYTARTDDNELKTKGLSSFTLLKFAASDVEIEQISEGKLYSIKIPKYSHSEAAYLRIRFDGDPLKFITLDQKLPNSLFQGLFSAVEIVDIRVNEPRLMKRHFREQIRTSGSFAFSLAHIFYVCTSAEDVNSPSKNYKGYRHLESCIWKRYVANPLPKKSHMLAHHWKFAATDAAAGDSTFPSLSTIVRCTYAKCQSLTISLSILGIIILSIIANIATSHVEDLLKYGINHLQNASKPSIIQKNDQDSKQLCPPPMTTNSTEGS